MKVSDIQVDYVDHMGSDMSVVNAARVSFSKEAANYTDEQNEKLISYLARNKHTSPFNHAFLSVHVKAPIFVARQLVKHKFMPWNEVSRRYVDDEPEFYIPEYYRKRSDSVKQGSYEEDSKYPISASYYITGECFYEYNKRIQDGVCPEQARDCLPLNTMTEWIWSGSLGAFSEMLKLRLDLHTQYESRIVAEKVYEIVASLYPISIKALLENK